MRRSAPSVLTVTLRSVRHAAAACVLPLIIACSDKTDAGGGGGGGGLNSLTLNGTPGASGEGAARSSTGHYFVRAINGAGTTVRLVPGAAQWEAYGTGHGAPSAPQYDGSMYVVSTSNGLMEVRGADYVTVIGLPQQGAQFLAKTDDGRLHMVSATLVSGVTYSYTFWSALPTDATWRNDGSGLMPFTKLWMTSKGRVFGWRRSVGVLLINPANLTSTTVVACGQPGASAIDCPNIDLSGIADRRGSFYFVSTLDGNGAQVELWSVPDASTSARREAGPALPQLQLSGLAGNNSRPGGNVSLYADPSNRIWMAFRWGANNSDDTSYLYRFSGSGWTYVRRDLSRNVILFGEGSNPGILGVTLLGSMQVWTLP